MGWISFFFSKILTPKLSWNIWPDLKLADPTSTLWCFYCQNITFHNSVHFICAHLWLCHLPEWHFIVASIKEFGFFVVKVHVLRQASVTIWFPSSHSSPCWGCTFPSPQAPILSWTFSVDWNDWKGWGKKKLIETNDISFAEKVKSKHGTRTAGQMDPVASRDCCLKHCSKVPLSHVKSRFNLSKQSVLKLWWTLAVTCTGIHPSLSLKYSPLRSFLNTSALARCTRSISSSLFTTNIYTTSTRAAEHKRRGRCATETYLWFNWSKILLQGLFQRGSGVCSFQREYCERPWNHIRSDLVDLEGPCPPFPQLKKDLQNTTRAWR